MPNWAFSHKRFFPINYTGACFLKAAPFLFIPSGKLIIMKFILLFILVSGLSLQGYSQCDKTLQMKSVLTTYLDSSDKVTRTVEETTIIEISKTSITIKPGDSFVMTGPVSSYTCNWTVPYKEGKMVLKANVVENEGTTQDITVNIENVQGKIYMTVLIEKYPDMKIRVELVQFEEKK